MKQKHKPTFLYFSRGIFIVLGLVLMWRGIWYILDGVDLWFFDGSHAWTALGGIFLGLLILYLPDKDLSEIEKL
ncbi:MAG: hypothetical protein WD897_00955 [Parcubacteria group bacterium]